MNSWALITGATSGIGLAIAEQMAKNNWNLIITGRRDQRLWEIKSRLEEDFSIQVEPLCFDLSKRSLCENIFNEHSNLLSKISVLINNAGLARGMEPMDVANINDWEEMIDTNIKGLLYLTRLSLPFLKQNTPSHIVNIGSVAGRWSYPGGGVYCSTKFAVRALTEGLRMDLNGSDIRVTNISPGLVETEFSQIRLQDAQKAKSVYKGLEALRPEDIAECVCWTLHRPKHVNIQEMVVYPTAQASVNQVHRNL